MAVRHKNQKKTALASSTYKIFVLLFFIVTLSSLLTLYPSSPLKSPNNYHYARPFGQLSHGHKRGKSKVIYVHNDNNDECRIQEHHLFVFGMGNVGDSIASLILQSASLHHNHSSAATTIRFRSICGTVVPSDALNESNGVRWNSSDHYKNTITEVERIPFDNAELVRDRLSVATHVLVTVGVRAVATNDTKNGKKCWEDPVLARGYYKDLPKNGCWVGYLSTTGVYRDHGGGWVDEESLTISTSTKTFHPTKASAYLASEKRWADVCVDTTCCLRIFRCAAIYGEKSSALHTFLRKERRQKDNNEGVQVKEVSSSPNYVSRIHMTDLCRALLSSMSEWDVREKRNPQHNVWLPPSVEVYNVADDEPCPRSSVMSFVEDLVSRRISLNEVSLLRESLKSSSSSSDYGGRQTSQDQERSGRRNSVNKRVSNRKMMRLLRDESGDGGGGLIYPTYREGIEAVLDCLLQQRESVCHKNDLHSC